MKNIEIINCNLSENMNNYIELLDFVKDLFNKSATKILMVPSKYFNK